MPGVMGRLFDTAENLRRNYPGLDEPLIICESEVDHVAIYVAKMQRGPLAQELAQSLRENRVQSRIFGFKLRVI